MAVCTPDLTKVNMLTPVGFRLTIDSTEFRNLQYFCVAVSLPSVSTSPVDSGFRNLNTPVPGDYLSYSPLGLTFIVDEEMTNYLEAYNWLYRIAHDEVEEKDITLSILSNKNNTNKQVQFMNAFPTSLSELAFDTRSTDIEYLTCDLEFSYSQFKFV